MKRTYIDPPSGWQYGFPKVLPAEYPHIDLVSWLLRQGYPDDLIPYALKYSRYWEEDIDE